MSGGRWGYQRYRLEEKAEEVGKLLQAVAETEELVDWAVSGDSNQAEAGAKLLALWERTFTELYGGL